MEELGLCRIRSAGGEKLPYALGALPANATISPQMRTIIRLS